jgi:hypothetical protein
VSSNRLVFIRSLRKHALLRKIADLDDKAAVEFDRKLSGQVRKIRECNERETTQAWRNNT